MRGRNEDSKKEAHQKMMHNFLKCQSQNFAHYKIKNEKKSNNKTVYSIL